MAALAPSKLRPVYYTIMFFDGDWNEIPELHRDWQNAHDLIQWTELFNEVMQQSARGNNVYHPLLGTARCMGLEVHFG